MSVHNLSVTQSYMIHMQSHAHTLCKIKLGLIMDKLRFGGSPLCVDRINIPHSRKLLGYVCETVTDKYCQYTYNTIP